MAWSLQAILPVLTPDRDQVAHTPAVDSSVSSRLHATVRALEDGAGAEDAARLTTQALDLVRELDVALNGARDAAIVHLRCAGWTLQDIADLVGVTRARIHQICAARAPAQQRRRPL